MKKSVLALSFLSVTILLPSSVLARDFDGVNPSFKAERKELRSDFNEKIQELREGFKQKIGGLKSQMAKIAGGEITAISGTTLTVSKDDKTYTVNTDANTHFQRHFWGKSSLAEFSVGNKVNVHGKFTDDTKTTILARLVRNLSIMKRHGVFLGDVTAKNSDNFVINSKNRGEQTVFFNSTTKFVKRNQTALTYAELQVGHRVRVKGLWDKSSNEITETVQVKDYNLPPKTAKTGSPTGAVIPTITATPTLSITPSFTPTASP